MFDHDGTGVYGDGGSSTGLSRPGTGLQLCIISSCVMYPVHFRELGGEALSPPGCGEAGDGVGRMVSPTGSGGL
jgi:hypothetical protein